MACSDLPLNLSNRLDRFKKVRRGDPPPNHLILELKQDVMPLVEKLWSLISPAFQLQEIVAVPQKQFCYLSFASHEATVRCQTALNGSDFLSLGSPQTLMFRTLKPEKEKSSKPPAILAPLVKIQKKVPSLAVDSALLVGEQAAALEAKHVHEIYDAIALHFSNTRYQPWFYL